ncbi:kelch-like protein 5 [Eurosta solidaginis]|uniref:kelch-like protein 5 n=1 Tax=Eurosta solidaginis TaxID=178769 RepID=UPI003530AD92
MSTNKESPSRESMTSSSAPISLLADGESLTRDYSLGSLTSAVSQDEYFRCRDHAESVLKRLQMYLDSHQLCDVVLIAGIDGRRIPAHRIVLSASSAYFAAMFTGSLRETKEQEVTLGEVHGDALQILIQYCYTGYIELREDTVETLLATACLLQLNAVVTACCNFLARQLHPSNCLGFAFFAERQSCTTLLRLAKSYTCQHFMQVCKNQEFLQLDSEQLGKLISSDDLNVPTEEDVVHSLKLWVQHDAINREKHIPELLALVRLPLLKPSFIMDHVETLCSSNECQQLVMEALKWHLLPERRNLLALIASERTKPRKSTVGRLLAVGGMDAHKGAISIESYCPYNDKWSVWKNMSARRLQFGVAVMDDKLVIVGGRDGLKTLNTVESLDLNTMAWTALNPMGTHRHGLGVAVLEGPLYAVGGHDGWSYLSTVERWDPTTRTWSYVASLSSMRSTAGVAVLGGRLYVVGGRDGSVCHRSIECFDPHTNKWTMRAPMNKRRGGVGVAVANGFLYALGGHDCPASNPSVCRTDTVERYDPATDSWTLICSLNAGRDAIGCALLGDRLMAIGGYDGNHYLKTVEVFNAETNEWAQAAPLTYSRAGACVVAVPNVIPPTPPLHSATKKWKPVRLNPMCYRRTVEFVDYYNL